MFLAPFVFFGYETIITVPGKIFSLIEVFPITILFSTVFSFPTLIAAILILKFNVYFGLNSLSLKVVIWSVWLIGIYVTLKLIGGSVIPVFIICYLTAAFISVIILEFREIFNLKNFYKKDKIED